MTPPQPTYPIPFMANKLKPDYVPREELQGIIGHFLTRDDRAAITSALQGAGGYGKTTIAQAVCYDPRIWGKFSGGILWVTLGESPPDARAQLLDLYRLLTKSELNLTEINAIKAALNQALEDRPVLLVIDDLWRPEHLTPFLLNCTLLITTRH
ncbi:MAG: NB-ARC domain-containing protein, partial [Anaerolineae bacterium]|nr:NB-ARC domain-containing protein [Anaerolineae bacterium]